MLNNNLVQILFWKYLSNTLLNEYIFTIVVDFFNEFRQLLFKD